MVYLTCEAFDFFPCNISVLWFRDEEPMSRDAQEFGDVLRDGNGTYYTWETIRIPQGEELRVKCIVEHSGNHSTHLPPLGKTLAHRSSWWIVSVSVAVVFIIGFCVYVILRRGRQHQLQGGQSLLDDKTWINSRRNQLIIMASHTQNFSPCVTLRLHQFNRGSLESAARRPEFSS
ncbi:MHC class I polypeptide-related sequence A-like [Bos indicus]|uniref:MHC class I polypeptide-related sequence A-like n=1 Tax=Bos indicus TaxID=9915 RepID=A0ABM4RFL6_BOSIN